MKQLYKAPKIEIELLSCRDVLETSDPENEENWGPLYPMNPTFE